MTKLLVVVTGGDSIASTDGAWPYQSVGFSTFKHDTLSPFAQSCFIYRKSDGSILLLNMAIPATRLNTNGFPDLIPLAPGYIDPVVVHKADTPAGSIATRRYLFVNAIGSNDGALQGGSVSAFAVANAAAAVARKTAGFDLCAMATLLPRTDTGTLSEVNRTAYNSLLTDSSWRATNNIDYVVDLASEATMGNPATLPNTTYYVDGVHPTPVGFALLVPIVTSVYTAVLATF